MWLSPCLSKKVPLCAQVTFPLPPKTKGDFFVGVFWFYCCLKVGGLQKLMSASASMLPAACTPARGLCTQCRFSMECLLKVCLLH